MTPEEIIALVQKIEIIHDEIVADMGASNVLHYKRLMEAGAEHLKSTIKYIEQCETIPFHQEEEKPVEPKEGE